MQERLLGDLPVLAGIETAARYLPATTVPSVGGDWYEGLLLGRSKMAVVVGDVAGHGITAAADMALIRGMISALLHSGVAASDVFSEVSGVLVQRTAYLLATAALAIVDVAADTITFATAGHPPPLLRSRMAKSGPSTPRTVPIIGLRNTEHEADTAPFPRGSQLVMYTDGLVERRNRPFDVGVTQIAHHLATLEQPLKPSDLVDSLLATLLDEGKAEDDVAILVVEHTA